MIIEIEVTGLTPLILDRFHSGILEARTAGTTNKGEEETPHEQALAKLYLYEDGPRKGKPYFPASNLFTAIIEAGRFVKIGKRQLSTRDQTIVPSFLSMLSVDCPIISKEGWRVDARGIVNQVTKARVMAYRPIFDDWKFSFTLDLDTKEGKPATARELVDRAGRAIGIGVMRPSRKGGYGQFVVTKWVQKKVEKGAEIPVAEAAE